MKNIKETPSIYRFIYIFALLIILIGFFSFFMIPKNKIIGYRTIFKDLDEISGIPSYKSNQEKYQKKSCNELCDKEICTEFELQKKKYSMCKFCKEKGQCYHPFQGICTKCNNSMSCEEIYGCEGKEPIDPFKKECNFCWPKIY